MWNKLTIATLFVLAFPIAAWPAEEAGEAPPTVPFALAGFQINGRFDLNYERTTFSGSPSEGEDTLKNYHHFIFLSRRKKDEPFSFTAEIVDQTFYEMGVKLGEGGGIRFGKVLVPFGADPLFHHSYGGVTGADQKLVPFIWSELGVVYDRTFVQSSDFRLDGNTFLVSGYKGDDTKVLALNGAGDPSKPAVGQRLRLGTGKYSLFGSVYYDQYVSSKSVLLYSLEATAGYGFLPWSILKNVSARAGALRADVKSDALGNYYHFGDYLQVDCRLPFGFRGRYRGGAVTNENHTSLYFDDKKKDVADTVNHTVALFYDYRLLTLGAEYLANLEAVGEQKNDLIRVLAVLEF
ncbi:MAG: hypothetical protein HYY13_05955 [Nitrospirae bacterium]|nr:hypothetical protein [Nitrospirota bacterium]